MTDNYTATTTTPAPVSDGAGESNEDNFARLLGLLASDYRTYLILMALMIICCFCILVLMGLRIVSLNRRLDALQTRQIMFNNFENQKVSRSNTLTNTHTQQSQLTQPLQSTTGGGMNSMGIPHNNNSPGPHNSHSILYPSSYLAERQISGDNLSIHYAPSASGGNVNNNNNNNNGNNSPRNTNNKHQNTNDNHPNKQQQQQLQHQHQQQQQQQQQLQQASVSGQGNNLGHPNLDAYGSKTMTATQLSQLSHETPKTITTNNTTPMPQPYRLPPGLSHASGQISGTQGHALNAAGFNHYHPVFLPLVANNNNNNNHNINNNSHNMINNQVHNSPTTSGNDTMNRLNMPGSPGSITPYNYDQIYSNLYLLQQIFGNAAIAGGNPGVNYSDIVQLLSASQQRSDYFQMGPISTTTTKNSSNENTQQHPTGASNITITQHQQEVHSKKSSDNNSKSSSHNNSNNNNNNFSNIVIDISNYKANMNDNNNNNDNDDNNKVNGVGGKTGNVRIIKNGVRLNLLDNSSLDVERPHSVMAKGNDNNNNNNNNNNGFAMVHSAESTPGFLGVDMIEENNINNNNRQRNENGRKNGISTVNKNKHNPKKNNNMYLQHPNEIEMANSKAVSKKQQVNEDDELIFITDNYLQSDDIADVGDVAAGGGGGQGDNGEEEDDDDGDDDENEQRTGMDTPLSPETPRNNDGAPEMNWMDAGGNKSKTDGDWHENLQLPKIYDGGSFTGVSFQGLSLILQDRNSNKEKSQQENKNQLDNNNTNNTNHTNKTSNLDVATFGNQDTNTTNATNASHVTNDSNLTTIIHSKMNKKHEKYGDMFSDLTDIDENEAPAPPPQLSATPVISEEEEESITFNNDDHETNHISRNVNSVNTTGTVKQRTLDSHSDFNRNVLNVPSHLANNTLILHKQNSTSETSDNFGTQTVVVRERGYTNDSQFTEDNHTLNIDENSSYNIGTSTAGAVALMSNARSNQTAQTAQTAQTDQTGQSGQSTSKTTASGKNNLSLVTAEQLGLSTITSSGSGASNNSSMANNLLNNMQNKQQQQQLAPIDPEQARKEMVAQQLRAKNGPYTVRLNMGYFGTTDVEIPPSSRGSSFANFDDAFGRQDSDRLANVNIMQSIKELEKQENAIQMENEQKINDYNKNNGNNNWNNSNNANNLNNVNNLNIANNINSNANYHQPQQQQHQQGKQVVGGSSQPTNENTPVSEYL